MFGDGKIKMINQDGDLYINMWETVQHLINSAYELEEAEGPNVASSALRLVAATMCDLAMYELGMEALNEFDSVQELIDTWESHRQ